MKYRMIAKVFPAYHPRRGQPTGFADAILTGRKIHTLRNTAGGLKDGDEVSLRQWAGKPYWSKQVEFARCRVKVSMDVHVGDAQWSERDSFENALLYDVSTQDGFDNVRDFIHWFTGGKDVPLNWRGVCIWFHNVKATEGAQ